MHCNALESARIGSIEPALYAAEMACQQILSGSPPEELVSNEEFADLIGTSVDDLNLGIEVAVRNQLSENQSRLYGRRKMISCHGIFEMRKRVVGLTMVTASVPWKYIDLPRVEPLTNHSEFERLLVEGSLAATQPNLLDQDNKVLRKNTLFELVFDERRVGMSSLIDARLRCLAELTRRECDPVQALKACNTYYDVVADATFATYPAGPRQRQEQPSLKSVN
ncbi:MAG: hypothetical protein B7Z80_04020 [Rhodospirillales bacterium 20-64-7]|nr:MAG: hypothetical protein B7Z80_04020 [Rhodospirillales bacterium 20-64-7]